MKVLVKMNIYLFLYIGIKILFSYPVAIIVLFVINACFRICIYKNLKKKSFYQNIGSNIKIFLYFLWNKYINVESMFHFINK